MSDIYATYTLPTIRDAYPTGTDNINTSFSIPDPSSITLNQAYTYPSETLVKFRGKYPQNVINFAIQSLDQIKESTITEANGQPLSFQFIVNFPNPDGTPDYWTSPIFKSILRNAQNSGNPYLRLEKVPIITIDFNQLASYSKSEQLTLKEAYAGVNIVQTMNTKEDMLLHINWVVGSDEALRPVQGNSKYKRFGNWQIVDDPTLIEEWAQFLETLESTEWPEFQDAVPPTPSNNSNVDLTNLVTNGLTTDQGTSQFNGLSIITPLGGNPLDPLNLNGTQTNDVNYNIFDAFNGNTNLTLADGTVIPIDITSTGTGGASSGIVAGEIVGTGTTLPIGPITINPLNIGVGGVNTTLGTPGIGSVTSVNESIGTISITNGLYNPTGNTGIGGGLNVMNYVNNPGLGLPIIGDVKPFSVNLPPFNVTGRNVGEVRAYNGLNYTWSGTSWVQKG